MSDKVAGAPIRAWGSLLVIWMFVRVISWNVPANILVEPTKLTMEKTANRGAQPIHNVATQHSIKFQFSPPFTTPDAVAHEQGVKSVPSPTRTSKRPLSKERGVHQRDYLLTMIQPEFASYRLSPGASSKQDLHIEPRIEQNRPMRYSAAKQRRKGLRGYSWVFARQASQSIKRAKREDGAIISNGQYGGSQIGAILSYPILIKPDPQLAVYGRLSSALAPLSQEEVAIGLTIHPMHSLPFSIYGEQRLAADNGGDRGTAFYVAGGTGPDPVIEKILLETYGQAGYVLGENETHFFDGSATLLRPIAETDRKKLFIGTGLWAGGQRQISRLDVGPRVDLSVPLGTTSARLAVDWRVRVAGHARPESGLAITVSTGF